MALSIMRNGVPLDQLYGPKGASTAAATGCMQNGVDVNQYLLALADGKALGFNSGLSKNGTDFSAIFGIPTGNTPLPINGQAYVATDNNAGTTNSAQLNFVTNNSAWSVNDLHGGAGGGNLVVASGSIPTGAVAVLMSWSQTSGSGNTVSNGASAWTTLTGTNVTLSSTASNVGHGAAATGGTISITIQYRNSASTVISITTTSFDVEVPAIP